MSDMDRSNGPTEPTDGNAGDWRKARRSVRNLRRRIVRAARENDLKRVRSLQKLMLRSRADLMLSIRRATRQIAGRNTPGVDRVLVETPAARGRLVAETTRHQPRRVRPVRRVYLPKADGKQRPLGVPTIRDRCLQGVVRNAPEPEREARCEASRYGFRPGRGCHDAVARIDRLAEGRTTRRRVIDADIKGAVDHIGHESRRSAIGRFPARELIRQRLKAGYVDYDRLRDTPEGTPPGGVISPLPADIAFHGIEQVLGVATGGNGHLRSNSPAPVRDADDFVVFCHTEEEARRRLERLRRRPAERNLQLSEEKTCLVEFREGLDFLGFTVRHDEVPTGRTGRRLQIQPGRKALRRIRERRRAIWKQYRTTPATAPVAALNPVIRGWANCFRVQGAGRAFAKPEKGMQDREMRYAERRHPGKSRRRLVERYWGTPVPGRRDRWVFGDKSTGAYRLRFSRFRQKHHVPVFGTLSVDDARLRSCRETRRLSPVSNLSRRDRQIARRQQRLCPVCGDDLLKGEELHRHHRTPRSPGGPDTLADLELLHLYCRRQVHHQQLKPDHGS